MLCCEKYRTCIPSDHPSTSQRTLSQQAAASSGKNKKSVTVTIKLNNLIFRAILVAAGLFVVLFIARVLFSNFLVRNIADPRIVLSRDVLASAAMKQPDSPKIFLRLANSEIEDVTSEPQQLLNAQAHALKAASLSPWDYRTWRSLGMAQDADGKLEEAIRAMRIAGKIAPNSSEVNWALANMLIRQGNRPEALKAFQLATKYSNELLPAAMEVVWQAFDNDIEVLNSLVKQGDSTSRMMMAQFLIEQAKADDAIVVFQSIDGGARLNSQNAATFLSQLIQSGRSSDARRLWAELVGASVRSGNQDDQSNLIWNGSFETNAPKNFGHFDWAITPSDYARIGFDRNVFRGGQKSLRLNFVGRDTTRLMGDIQQMVVLNANKKYRLECFARAGSLVTPEGPRIALLGQTGIVAVSEAVAPGSTDWQRLVVEFTAPDENTAAQVAIIRVPRFDYDEPTKGTVWFDDFKLTEL